MNPEPIISTHGISKRFGGVTALSNVNFSISEGEIHAIVGENGAGKSTMMKILAGVYQPDGGEFRFKGEAVSFATPIEARDSGISIVFQELNLYPDLSVYRNIFINREITGRMGAMDVKLMVSESKEIIASLGATIDPDMKVRSLTTAEQQIVEIARALSQKSQVLILDEPNSALGEVETIRLFEILKDLKKAGLTILYISHRLEEVFSISDRISVFRDGQYIDTHDISSTSIPEMITLMIGRKLEKVFPSRKGSFVGDSPICVIRGLSKTRSYHDIDLSVYKGEIVGVYGLEGCGKEALFNTIFGIDDATAGEIKYNGEILSLHSPSVAIDKGLAMIPPDRRRQGIMIEWSILENIVLVILDRIKGLFGMIDRKRNREVAQDYVKRLRIETDGLGKLVNNLSGGNQQKVVIAKWLATSPKFLLMNDPTRGIDVGTKYEVYQLMNDLADGGLPILFTSSEIDEVIGLSDRILILHKGQIVYEGERGQRSKEQLLHYVNMGTK